MGGGTVLDLGIYTIQVSQWAFQEPPQQIVAKGELNSEGVDVDVEAELIYSGKRKSKMHTSAKKQLDNKAVIKGSKGQITVFINMKPGYLPFYLFILFFKLLQFWCPTKIIDIDGQEKEWVLPKGKLNTVYQNSEGLRYEAEAARQSILEGKLQNENVSHNDSLLFAQIEDEIRKQIGVVFPED